MVVVRETPRTSDEIIDEIERNTDKLLEIILHLDDPEPAHRAHIAPATAFDDDTKVATKGK